MKPIRFLPVALTVLLAACGGTGPTPTPTPTPDPPTTPTEPVDPSPAEPDVPGESVMYYGEWGWSFQGGESYQTREGRFSIIDTLEPDVPNASYGLFQNCYNQCYDSPEGYAVMGIDGNGKLSVRLYRLSSTDDLVPLYEVSDSDGELETDDRGRLVFEGRGTAYEEFSDVVRGDFRAVFIADEPALAFAP